MLQLKIMFLKVKFYKQFVLGLIIVPRRLDHEEVLGISFKINKLTGRYGVNLNDQNACSCMTRQATAGGIFLAAMLAHACMFA